MKVLTSEINRVLSSSDYSLFKYEPKPKFFEKKLMILISEMSLKNLSKDLPIIIDKEYNILDGVYRFEANKALGAPVYYKVAEVSNRLDLMQAGSLVHKPTDFEFLYYHRDKLAYRKVLEWSDLLPYSYAEIIGIFEKKYLNKKCFSDYKMFKDGLMEYSKEDDFRLKKAQEFITKFTEKFDYLPIKLDTILSSILGVCSYNVDVGIVNIQKLKFFNEFVRLYNEGHPVLQNPEEYFDEAFNFEYEERKGANPSIEDTETKYHFWGRGDRYSREYQGHVYPILNAIKQYHSA